MENLDRLCAEYGYKFAEEIKGAFFKKDAKEADSKKRDTEEADAEKKDAEKAAVKKAESLITKALGVLQEQGLYAFVLFCESRGSTEKEGAEEMKKITKELLKDKLSLISNDDLLNEIRKDNGLASRLDDLLLAIQVLEKSLIYARYHAKAFTNSQEKANNQNSKDSEEQ
jgi:hypothetical protein